MKNLVDIIDKLNLDCEYEWEPTSREEQFFFFNRSQFEKAVKAVTEFACQPGTGISHYTVDFNYIDMDEDEDGGMAIFVTYDD